MSLPLIIVLIGLVLLLFGSLPLFFLALKEEREKDDDDDGFKYRRLARGKAARLGTGSLLVVNDSSRLKAQKARLLQKLYSRR
jgi:hypothetical protein